MQNKWNGINDLLGKNKTYNVASMSVGNDEINNHIEIVVVFNNYFRMLQMKQ